MRKKHIWVVVLVVLIVVSSYIYFNKKNVINTPIKIGSTLSLTGNLAYIGKSNMNGLTLAAEEINNNGGINGRKIQIIVEDNQGDPKLAVTGVQKLLNVDNVDLLFSAFTPITKAISSIVKVKGIPMLYASTDGSIAQQSPVFFRDYFDAEQSGVALFNKIQSDNRKNVKIIGEQSDPCLLLVKAFKKEASTSGVKIIDETYFQPTDSDLRSHVTKLNLKDGEVLLACAYRHSNILIKNMSDLDYLDIPTYQLTTPFLPVASELVYREMFSKNKTVSTWYGFADKDNTPIQEKYIKNYKARFNEDPNANSSYSYDDMYVLAGVLGKCLKAEKIDNECFSEEMSKVDYDGVAGKLTFDDEGRSNRSTLIIQAENNQWKTVK